MEINLGAGRFPKHEGAINIDKVEGSGMDYLIDLEKAELPFKTSTITKIYAEDLLEHIKNLIPLMNECWRVMAYGGEMVITVPSYDHIDAFSDPTHVRFFTEDTFKYFSDYVNTEWVNFDYGIKKWGESKIVKDGNKLRVSLWK
jgi:predicted SAM-dependent methyltransferase